MSAPNREVAVIAGVGRGLGASLARKLAREGCAVALLARSADVLNVLAEELHRAGARALPCPTDLTDVDAVAKAFAKVRSELGPVSILINHVGSGVWGGFNELTAEDFKATWDRCALAAFLCCKQVVPDMLAQGGGSILFTGATSSIRGRKGAPAFSSAKFAVRGLADSLAREFWPQGIHVAHIIVDGVIDTEAVRAQTSDPAGEPMLSPEDMAETYWALIRQKPGAWTFELELRPKGEDFFV
ncbi:MAG: SDR family NAD(P)-dependent oxidoreductase [Nitrospira sp.]|nr:SDR family NAD(P)-dependent oxidoreductase [Nitrospira sp.]